MLGRLSKLGSQLQPTVLRLAALSVALAAACGGQRFSAGSDASGAGGSGGSGGSGNSSGTSAGTDDAGSPSGGDSGSRDDAGSSSSGNGGDAGDGDSELGGKSGRGGSAGSVATAGTAGKAATGCASCTAGMYCQTSVNKCRSCADLSRVEFAAPEALRTLSHSGGSVERFPRSASTGSASTASALFYTEDSVAGRAIWYTTAPTSGIGSVAQASTSAVLGSDSGPLLAPGFVDKNFFFDRQVAGGQRQIWAGNWSDGTLSQPSAVAAPINTAATGIDDFSFAAAPSAGHAYWMSTRNGTLQLIWESINETPMNPPASLTLEIKVGATTCQRVEGVDATPWVNLAGTLLLFSAVSLADTCQANDNGARDLFAVPLAKSGLPASAAIALSALNNTGGASDETDPSLSPDACSIYFASNNGTGDYDLYRATRN